MSDDTRHWIAGLVLVAAGLVDAHLGSPLGLAFDEGLIGAGVVALGLQAGGLLPR